MSSAGLFAKNVFANIKTPIVSKYLLAFVVAKH